MNPRCSRCGAVLRTAGLFCEACGQRVVATIEDAAPMPRQTVYSPSGTLVLPEEAPEDVDEPEEEAEELDLEPIGVGGDQHVVTVLFTDLAGYGALADSFYRALAEPVYRHGGVIDTHVRDAVVAFFGAPLAHGDDAVQALRAAIEMQAVGERFASELEAQAGERVSLRIGVDTGPARVGAAPRKAFAVKGRPVARAQEAEAAAPPGGILITEDTRQATHGAFEIADRGVLEAAGEKAPVFQVLAEAAGPDGPAGGMRVGREAELGLLARAWSDVLGGQPAIVYVRSPAGHGKTALLVRLFGAGDSRAVVWTRCSPYEAAEPLGWLKRAVRGLLGAPEEDTGYDGLLALIRRSAFHLVDDPEACDLLDLLLHGRVSEDLAGIGPQHLKAMIFRTAAALLVGRAKTQPLALLADDLHWIDDGSAEFLQSLFRAIKKAKARVCFVGAYRPGVRLVPSPAGTLPLREIVLKSVEGLPAPQDAPIKASPPASAPPAVAAELYALSQDAPAAADAYLRAAERSLSLFCNHEALRQAAAARQWAERAGSAHLAGFERRALTVEAEAAAAIGDHAGALGCAQRLIALAAPGDVARAHARYGEYLVRLGRHQDAIDACEAARLAAGTDRTGLAWLAGRAAHARLLLGDAAGAAAAASDALEAAPPGEHAVRALLHRTLGMARLALADAPGAIEALRDALDGLARSGDLEAMARCLQDLAGACEIGGQEADARRYLNRGLQAATRLGDRHLVSDLMNALGMLEFAHGDIPRAKECFLKALEAHRDGQDRQGEGLALVKLGEVSYHLAEYDLAQRHLMEALMALEEMGLKPALAEAYRLLAQIKVAQDRPREAVQLATRACNLAKDTGQVEAFGGLQRLMAEIHAAMDRMAEAVAWATRAVDTLKATSSPVELGRSFALLAKLLAESGQLPQAQEAAVEARKLFEQHGARSDQEKFAPLAAMLLAGRPASQR